MGFETRSKEEKNKRGKKSSTLSFLTAMFFFALTTVRCFDSDYLKIGIKFTIPQQRIHITNFSHTSLINWFLSPLVCNYH